MNGRTFSQILASGDKAKRVALDTKARLAPTSLCKHQLEWMKKISLFFFSLSPAVRFLQAAFTEAG